MKHTLLIILSVVTIGSLYAQDQFKASVDKKTGDFSVFMNKYSTYRVVGYDKPDTNSTKLISFSVWTKDVEKNKCKCKLGTFYDVSHLKPGTEIKYQSTTGNFAKMKLTDAAKRNLSSTLKSDY